MDSVVGRDGRGGRRVWQARLARCLMRFIRSVFELKDARASVQVWVGKLWVGELSTVRGGDDVVVNLFDLGMYYVLDDA